MIQGVIFDLDGVIVSTDELHYQGWKHMAETEKIYFDREINERLRGVSRMESLEIILEKATKTYTDEEKEALATLKNDYYKLLLSTKLTAKDILPGVKEILAGLKAKGIKIAIGSSSKNSPTILEQIGLAGYFDAEADGNDIKESKPHPEVFLLAAEKIALKPENCLVVEDAEAGVTAALAAGMKVLAVGAAITDERANLAVADLSMTNVEQLLSL